MRRRLVEGQKLETLSNSNDPVATAFLRVRDCEEALVRSEEKRRCLTELLEVERSRLVTTQRVAHVGSWEVDLVTVEIVWSEEMHRIYETGPTTFHPTASAMSALVHPDDLEEAQGIFSDSLLPQQNGYAQCEHRLLLPEGQIKFVEQRWQVFFDEAGKPARVVGVCQDITERKQSEAALSESQQRLALAAESAELGIWELDLVTNRLVWDERMYALYGITEENFTGAYDAWQNGLHPDDREKSEAELYAARDTAKNFHAEFRVLWPNGEVRNMEAHAIVQRAPDGSALRMIGVNCDSTQRKRLEQKVVHSLKLAALGELVAGVAHEINNPLAAISGHAQLLKMHPDSQVEQDAAVIEDMVKRAARIVHSLRSYARPSSGKKGRKRGDLNEAVSSALDVVAHKLRFADVTLTLNLAEDLPPVLMNFGEIEQVIVNLLSNAEQAVRDKPVDERFIRITTCVQTEVAARGGAFHRECVVEVRDGGIGMPESVRLRIFDPFFTTKDTGEGTGLGLYISHSIVTAHGGAVDVESEEGSGSAFRIILPADDSLAPRPTENA